ncbi:SET and MYND domain-containing protein 4-like [Macrobrachium nipponense]|uniref:SET and MYND domain-containing protein 4-like n=1 Tax=Macrobrachium nipponense TaxID=159736 RepID=UPI0030C8B4F8
MTAVPCFESLFSNLIKNLKENDQVIEVSSHFGPNHSLESMFSYLWNLDEARSCLLPTIIVQKKSEEDAERLRNEGNKCYQKKILDKALKLYNLSIMSAPHPGLSVCKPCGATKDYNSHEGQENHNEEQEYRSLALGYANRSAVFFELGQYDKCIADIDLAFLHGYPKLLHCKLAERKSKCLISLGKSENAKQVLLDALKELDDMKLDESKSKTSRNALHNLLEACQENGELNGFPVKDCNKLASWLREATKEELLFAYQIPEVPSLSQSNPAIPCLSDAVKLDFSPSQGRYLIAERDIDPGEVLVVEKPYGHVLHLDSSLRTHCCVCFNRCLSPLPCPSCSRVIFCSSSCRNIGLSSNHNKECCVLPTLAALDMGKNAVLAYRILIQIPFMQLKKLVPLYMQESVEFSPDKLGFNNAAKPIYDSSDYRTIYHLVTNKNQRSVSDLFKRCSMAIILSWILKESQSYFVDSLSEPYEPSMDDIKIAGCTLFTHLMSFPCNAHSITELQVDVSNFQKSSSQEIGAGAFGVLSLTNHSCNPSAARFSYGSTVILRAIRFIPRGAEVTDSYGEHYGLKPLTQRRSVLQQQYYFECKCEACENNWPTYLSLSDKYKLKCLMCSKKIDSKGKCTKCKVSFTELLSKNEIVPYMCNQKDVEKAVEEGVTNYESAYEKIISGDNSSEMKDSLCNIISLIDKFVSQPCKTYFEAQETLKHYFERQGSCVFRKEV